VSSPPGSSWRRLPALFPLLVITRSHLVMAHRSSGLFLALSMLVLNLWLRFQVPTNFLGPRWFLGWVFAQSMEGAQPWGLEIWSAGFSAIPGWGLSWYHS
jgi:hypothetical protein